MRFVQLRFCLSFLIKDDLNSVFKYTLVETVTVAAVRRICMKIICQSTVDTHMHYCETVYQKNALQAICLKYFRQGVFVSKKIFYEFRCCCCGFLRTISCFPASQTFLDNLYERTGKVLPFMVHFCLKRYFLVS